MSVPTDVEAGPDAVAAAAASCRHVARLSGGRASEVATYLPGRRVVGVRFADTAVEVHVVGVFGPTVAEIGSEVSAAVSPLVGGLAIDVVVEDLELPDRPARRRDGADDNRAAADLDRAAGTRGARSST